MITFRRPTDGDIHEIQMVALAAWSHAFAGIYAPATVRRKVAEYYSATSLGVAIREAEAGKAFFLVATDGRRLVGYANGGRIKNPWRDPSKPDGKAYHVSGWELNRIFLLPEFTGRGIGRGLLDRWEKFLGDMDADHYFVTYHRRNRLARDFYHRNGFVRAKNFDDGSAHCAIKEL